MTKRQILRNKINKPCLLTGAAKYVPRSRAARKTAKYKNFWVVMRQARKIDGCFFIRKYSEINEIVRMKIKMFELIHKAVYDLYFSLKIILHLHGCTLRVE